MPATRAAYGGVWTPWNGGERPVAYDALVQVQWRDEDRALCERTTPMPAGLYRWTYDRPSPRIVGYREVGS